MAIAFPPALLMASATAFALAFHPRSKSVFKASPKTFVHESRYGSTGINVLHDDFGAFFGKQVRCFGADALTASGYYRNLHGVSDARGAVMGGLEFYLTRQHALGEKVPRDLGNALFCHCC